MILPFLLVFCALCNGIIIANKPVNCPQHAGSSSVATSSFSGSSSVATSSFSGSSSVATSSSSASVCGGDFNHCHDRNATFKRCPNPCPGTCQNPNGVPNCFKMCKQFGCECKPGYVISDNGKCILLKDCPDYLRCKGDRNATFKSCPNPCPRTCKFPGGSGGPCSKMCLKEGCECKDGFYLSEEGKCVKLQDCPGARKCSANETFVFCNVGCPNNYCPVDDSRGIIACSPPFPCASGCSCKGGYLRLKSENDRCIQASECPPVPCTRPNEEYNSCPPPCLNDRCADIGRPSECDIRFFSCRPQCVCKPGFYRNDEDVCVPENKCPPKCGLNEMPVKCKTVCPPQSCENSYTEYACGNTTCEPGCDCLPNYLRNASGICIPNNECPPPPTCGLNEMPVKCKTVCPPQSCENSYTEYACGNTTCEPGCDCLPNYLRNASGICIPNNECPPPPTIPTCRTDLNEELSSCKIVCPPQTCESIYTLYLCVADIPCEYGCNCKKGYLRNSSNICVPSEKCPTTPPLVCGYNEKPSNCRVVCPPQTCDSIFTSYLCSNGEAICEPGCDCLDGYLRNSSGICIPSDKCFSEPECIIPPECRSTCANPNPKKCPKANLATVNQDGCQCKPGYILSKADGVCIPIQECPADVGCNGDLNAIATSCPWPCPSTCDSPNASSCGKKCKTVGCQCKPGFILSKGKCILPDKCPCGNPCGVNGTFSDCAFRCPNQNCPEDDSGLTIACKPGRPCPSGCLCKEYYRRKSETDDTCVLASDCPKINCTKPREVWNPCASECLAETCADIDLKVDCFADPKNCQPKCVCSKGFYRNNSGYCVSKQQCKPTCQVQQECRPTCAVPNPPGCPFITPSETNDDSCNCQQGYVLSKPGGTCIKVEECPTGIGCNGDPRARIKEFPLPCPSTCDAPNATPCKKKSEPIGCECEPGYILSENYGKCILPDDCIGGNPCGANATFFQCKYNCPTQYCPTDDSRAIVICETFPFSPCYSGCGCKLNHKILSRENPICIRSDECPAVKCTRQNEVWNSCPSDCRSEYCADVDKPPVTCNTLVLNCNPQCVCKKSFFRDPQTDLCVSSKECRKINLKNQQY